MFSSFSVDSFKIFLLAFLHLTVLFPLQPHLDQLWHGNERLRMGGGGGGSQIFLSFPPGLSWITHHRVLGVIRGKSSESRGGLMSSLPPELQCSLEATVVQRRSQSSLRYQPQPPAALFLRAPSLQTKGRLFDPRSMKNASPVQCCVFMLFFSCFFSTRQRGEDQA